MIDTDILNLGKVGRIKDENPTRKDLKEHDKKMQKSCIETGVDHEGLYGSMNAKWNYVWVFRANSFDHFLEMSRKVPRPMFMTHYITELLIAARL